MLRLALLSDTHLISPDAGSQSTFPRQIDALGPMEGRRMYDRIREETRRAFDACMNDIERDSPHRIIHLGDVTSGYGERGIAHPTAEALARDAARRCREIAETR